MHVLVAMILRKAHKDNFHYGTEYVRSILQKNFWILGLRNGLRTSETNVLSAAQSIQPELTDLRKGGMDGISYLFQNTGIDSFGPLEVKFQRKIIKYWCCLFTCFTTRAVEIEVVEGLDTDACLVAFTGFMERRGRPRW